MHIFIFKGQEENVKEVTQSNIFKWLINQWKYRKQFSKHVSICCTDFTIKLLKPKSGPALNYSIQIMSSVYPETIYAPTWAPSDKSCNHMLLCLSSSRASRDQKFYFCQISDTKLFRLQFTLSSTVLFYQKSVWNFEVHLWYLA